MDKNTAGIFTLIVILAAIVFGFWIWMLPYRIGKKRGIESLSGLFWVNLLLGWNFCWFVCLIWALTGASKASQVLIQRQTEYLESMIAQSKAGGAAMPSGRIEPTF